jgi:hypothetical protein
MTDTIVIMPTASLPQRLEGAWAVLRTGSPELPAARWSTPARGRVSCQGTDWWAEPLTIALAPDVPREPDSLLLALMHAAVHAVMAQRWVHEGRKPSEIDSQEGHGIRYWLHSATFKATCAELPFGLVAERGGSGRGAGYAHVSLPAELSQHAQLALSVLAAEPVES